MDRDPIRTAGREARRRRRLGSDAACAFCGEHRLESLLEKHHPLGRAHDPDLTIVLCLNCHAQATEGQLRGAVHMGKKANILDRAVAALRALSAFLEDALQAIEHWLTDLEELAALLDAKYASWRKSWERRK